MATQTMVAFEEPVAASSSSGSLTVDLSACGFNLSWIYASIVSSISEINDLTTAWNTVLSSTASTEVTIQDTMNEVTANDQAYLEAQSDSNKITKANSQLQTDQQVYESDLTPYTNAISNETSLTSSLTSAAQSLLSQISSYLDIWSQLASLLG